MKNIKNKMTQMIALGTFALTQLAYAGPVLPPFAQKVDVIKVNQVLAQLMSEVLAGDEMIENATIQFDPRHTNVDQYKAALLFEASARTTAWAPNRSSSVNIAAKLAPTRVNEQGIVRTDLLGQFQAGVTTDNLALTRFVAQKFTRNHQDCTNETRPEDKEGCVELHRLASADSLDTVASVIQNLRAIGLKYGEDEETRKMIEGITIRKYGHHGQVTSLSVTYSRLDTPFFSDHVLLKKAALKMTTESLQGAIVLQAKAEKEEFDSFRELARQYLLQIQSEDPAKQAELKGMIRDYLQLAKFVLGSSALGSSALGSSHETSNN
jgi:hypothetical protein